jgi:hypothetical protein
VVQAINSTAGRTDAHWWDLKRQARCRGHHRCEFCQIRPIYDLHHRTYQRFGKEKLDDVMAVCRRCHEAIHFGASIRVAEGSLGDRGDTGIGITILWEQYLLKTA